jgi:hypothetical protein
MPSLYWSVKASVQPLLCTFASSPLCAELASFLKYSSLNVWNSKWLQWGFGTLSAPSSSLAVPCLLPEGSLVCFWILQEAPRSAHHGPLCPLIRPSWLRSANQSVVPGLLVCKLLLAHSKVSRKRVFWSFCNCLAVIVCLLNLIMKIWASILYVFLKFHICSKVLLL